MSEKEIEYGFKAVSTQYETGKITSWRGHGGALGAVTGVKTPTRGRLYYEVGKWTIREMGNGPLAVFRTLNYARAFAARCGSLGCSGVGEMYAIYRCAYVPSKHKVYWYLCSDGNPWINTNREYDGKAYADAVCLLERVV